jgi:hypothetical protein
MTGRGLFLLAIFCGGMGCGSLGAADDRELTGRVVDAQSGAPIAHARVTVHVNQAAPQATELPLLSDQAGAFRVTGLPEGTYQVTCEKAGYLPSEWIPAAAAEVGKSVPLVVKLTAQAVVEGTVVDDKGVPVPNASVQLVRQFLIEGRRHLGAAEGGMTDETGEFRMFGLPAGRYYVAVVARIGDPRRARALAYPPIFYPNSTELEAAQPLDLKPGDERQIRMRLPEPLPAREIRGQIAASGASINLALTPQPSGQFLYPAIFDMRVDAKTGTFRISGVTAGTYLLTAGAQGGNGWLQAYATVTVGSADVTGIRLEPTDLGIDGTVRLDGNARTVSASVVLQGQRPGNAFPDADGKFHVPNVMPDTYHVVPTIMDGTVCVRSIEQGGRDVRDGLVVAPEGAREPVEIVLTSHCGSIAAAVTPVGSDAPANLFGALLRKGRDEWVLEKQVFGAGSRFLMEGVTPGDYMLYVWPMEAQIEYTNPEYMRQFESYGKAVTVSADGKVSVTVDKVLPGVSP